MLIALALATLTQPKAGPLDAYRVNWAAIKAAEDFDCRFWYNIDPRGVRHVLAFEPGPGPAPEPGYIAHGRWEFDGSCERYLIRLTGGTMFRPDATTGPLVPVEGLGDDETFAFHYLQDNPASLMVSSPPNQFPLPLVGPLTWNSFYRIDRDLQANYAGKAKSARPGLRGGRPTEDEVYERTQADSIIRREIAYDPGLGYLPRFCRSIAYDTDRGRSPASVIECYVLDAKPCRAGGFVPTEWYLISYHVDNFATKYPDYNETTAIEPPPNCTIIQYRATSFEEKTDQAKLMEMACINMILAPGGPIGFQGGSSPLSMSDLKAKVGRRAQPTNKPILPNIDQAELNEFRQPKPTTDWRPFLLGGLALAIGATLLIRRRAVRAALVLLALLPMVGCGTQKAVPRLTAAFTRDRLLYDPSKPALSMDLMIHNAGNQTLRILKVDAGCSCRHVDPTQLPATLRPGEGLKLAVGMSGGRTFAPETYVFTFTTDQGQFTAPVALLSLPRHQLSPDTVTLNGLYESGKDQEPRFTMVHREVFEPGKPDAGVALVVPEGFVREDLGVHEGRVASAPEFAYRDSEYRLTLRDKALGLHRAEVVARDATGRKLVEAPVVWQRLPFLSSVPDRVALSERPSRVFLRCPDEAVELGRILSTPPGIKAELDSPRSIRVALTDEAPATLQDFVEVETTAVGARPLRIPIARYSPVVARP